jgi:hypothetical protein
MEIKSSQIVYSEHGYDECFEYKDGGGRVPDGNAIGYESDDSCAKLVLFEDIKYSKYSHDYWDNIELEHDIERVIIP